MRPTLVRPPYGEYDDHVITAIRGMGLEPIQWDVDVSQTASSHWRRVGSGRGEPWPVTGVMKKISG